MLFFRSPLRPLALAAASPASVRWQGHSYGVSQLSFSSASIYKSRSFKSKDPCVANLHISVSQPVRLISWVGSREAMTPRPSQLDPYVPVSVHTAPDVLSCRFCPCERIDDNSDEPLEGCYLSSCYDRHQYGVAQLSH